MTRRYYTWNIICKEEDERVAIANANVTSMKKNELWVLLEERIRKETEREREREVDRELRSKFSSEGLPRGLPSRGESRSIKWEV